MVFWKKMKTDQSKLRRSFFQLKGKSGEKSIYYNFFSKKL